MQENTDDLTECIKRIEPVEDEITNLREENLRLQMLTESLIKEHFALKTDFKILENFVKEALDNEERLAEEVKEIKKLKGV
jgi:predicted  nucleic acid-binding Zn-ribbon protein